MQDPDNLYFFPLCILYAFVIIFNIFPAICIVMWTYDKIMYVQMHIEDDMNKQLTQFIGIIKFNNNIR